MPETSEQSFQKIPDDGITREQALFKFSAHAIEDLGVNLYTSMAKALVEFVANAWDARSSFISITYSQIAIEHAKAHSKADFARETAEVSQQVERANQVGGTAAETVVVQPLETRCLPADVAIVIEDDGDGMDRTEIEENFLVVGRRRRKDDLTNFVLVRDSTGVERRRSIMGRKGLGKLAGFGIAHRMVVTSRKAGCEYSTRITLDYDDLILPAAADRGGLPVPTEILKGQAGLTSHGTRIELSRLVYQSITWNPDSTLDRVISRNFGLIRPEEFAVRLNGTPLVQEVRDYQWAYPVDDARPMSDLIPETYTDTESSRIFSFSYRFRFTESQKYLQASERGVRVYAHNRLAAAPSLLGIGTSPRGFRYSDYLDGVIDADFIDDLPIDLVATDRSNLRWDIPPLASFREFVGDKLKKALGDFAKFREEAINREFEQDQFTRDKIDGSPLPPHRKRIARRFAKVLAQAETDGVNSEYYKITLAEVVDALDHGDILSAINLMTEADLPELGSLVKELTKLTQREFGEFLRFIQIRLKAIQALRRLVEEPGFRNAAKEKDLHVLLRDNPWLVNPQYFEWMVSNRSLTTLAGQLEERLAVGRHAVAMGTTVDPEMNDERPDLVSVIGSASLDVAIIELKILSGPLVDENLSQLTDYMRKVKTFLLSRNGEQAAKATVRGYLIGTMPDPSINTGLGCARLFDRIAEASKINPDWQVIDITTVLERAESVHREFIGLEETLMSETESV